MGKRRKRPENIPEIRSNPESMSWLLGFICAAQVIRESTNKMGDRFDAIDAGEEITELQKLANEIANDLIMTFPQSKRKTIRNQIGGLYFHMDVAPHIAKGDGTKTIVEVDTLGVVMRNAHEQCKLCANPERCRSCELGRAFDRCAPETRGKKESWADIDIG